MWYYVNEKHKAEVIEVKKRRKHHYIPQQHYSQRLSYLFIYLFIVCVVKKKHKCFNQRDQMHDCPVCEKSDRLHEKDKELRREMK